MDSFQESILPNFISFCLENQTPEAGTMSNPLCDCFTRTRRYNWPRPSSSRWSFQLIPKRWQWTRRQCICRGQVSEQGIGTVFVPRRTHWHAWRRIRSIWARGGHSVFTYHNGNIHTRTPLTVGSEGVANTNLAALESTLRIAMTSGTQLPQLLSISH